MATDKQTEFKVESETDSDLDLCDGELLSEKQLNFSDYTVTVPTQIKGDCLTKSQNIHFQTEAAISEQGTSGNSDNRRDMICTTRTVEDCVDGHLRKPPELMSDLKELECPDLPEYDSLQEDSAGMSDLKDFECEDLPEYDSLLEESTTMTTQTDVATTSTGRHASLDTFVSNSVNKPASRKMKSSPKTHRQVPYTCDMRSSSKSAKGKQLATEKGLAKDARSFQHKDIPQAKISLLTSEDSSQQSAGFSVSKDISMICESCSTHNSHNSMVECCVNHVICTQCVEKSAKAVLKGENKGFVSCSKDGCTSSIPLSELKKALPGIVLDLLEDCWKKETLDALEDMKDAVRCPKCDLPALLDMAIKQFQCTKCKKYYCRYCEIEWHLKPHELCLKTKSRTSKDTGTAIQIPAHWTDDCDKEIFTTVELDTKCHEFKEIKQLFNTSMISTSFNVQKIYRIQNVRLWDRYCLLRSHMVADLAEMHLKEMRLFHGTEQSVVDAICREGFDWRLCGKNGTAFGKGTYFARNASYANRYCLKEPRSVGLPTSVSSSVYTSVPFTYNQTSSPVVTNVFALGSSTNLGFKVGGSQQNPSSGVNFGSSQQNPSSGFNFGSSQQNPSSGFNFGSSQQNPSSGFNFGSSQQNPSSSFNIGSSQQNPSSNFNFGSSQQNPSSNLIFGSSQQNPSSGFNFGSSQQNPSLQSSSFQFGSRQCNINIGATSSNNLPTPNFPLAAATSQTSSGLGTSFQTKTNNTGCILSSNTFPSSGAQGFGSSHMPSTLILGNKSTSSHSSLPVSSGNIFDNQEWQLMFVGRVLVGRTCRGTSDMRRPGKDPHDPEGKMCHTAVDSVHNPRIFVTFDNAQCYPEYLIQYR